MSDYDWGKHARFVDIGGAYGSFLSDLLSRHPGSTGVLFDQSQVRLQDHPRNIASLLPAPCSLQVRRRRRHLSAKSDPDIMLCSACQDARATQSNV